MFRNKKAQGISINAIILAAIALIVLVVLVAIFTGRLGGFITDVKGGTGDSTQTCSAQSATFEPVDVCNSKKGITIASSDKEGGKICCKVRA